MNIDWTAFTPWHALGGGVLIGLAAAVLWLGTARIAGISGIVSGLVSFTAAKDDRAWRLLFVLGLVGGALLMHVGSGGAIQARSGFPLWLLLSGAFLVGIGTRMGSGCTSGHGVCGIARLSMRGLSATLTFMLTAIISVYLIRHVFELGVGS